MRIKDVNSNNPCYRVHHSGGLEELKLEQVPRPTPQAGEVLVHVHAAAVNPVDCYLKYVQEEKTQAMSGKKPLPRRSPCFLPMGSINRKWPAKSLFFCSNGVQTHN